MDGVSIRLDTGTAARFLNEAAEAADDLTPLTRNIGATLVQSGRDRISISNVGPDGVAWLPSARAKAEGGKTLEESGRLRDSIDYDAGPSGVAVGTNVIYAAIHQTGGVIKPKNGKALKFSLPGGGFATVASVTLPPRPFIGIDRDDENDIEALSVAFIARAAA